jgi:Pyridoxamine 5'-phosphate oxidase
MDWRDLQNSDPQLAEFGMKRLAGRVCYLATIQSNGAPRVHPVTPHFDGTTCFIYMEPTSPKGNDLRRDPRYALHCGVEDNDGGEGEFGVRGRAAPIQDGPRIAELFQSARAAGFHPKERYVVFELQIDIAFSTMYAPDGTPLRKTWKRV